MKWLTNFMLFIRRYTWNLGVRKAIIAASILLLWSVGANAQGARTAAQIQTAPFSQLTSDLPSATVRVCINCQANASTGVCESGAFQMQATRLNGAWKCTKFDPSGSGGDGVSSFNGRDGAVVPVSGDYDFNEISGVSQGVLLGRGASSGTGVQQEITVGSGLSLTGTTLTATGGGGGSISGSGTLGKIAKFTSSSAIGDSSITDTGSSINIPVGVFATNDLTVSLKLYFGTQGTNLNSATNGRAVFSNLAGTGFDQLRFKTSTGPYIEIGTGTDPSFTGFFFNSDGGGGGTAKVTATEFVAGATGAGNNGFTSTKTDGSVSIVAPSNSGTPYTPWTLTLPLLDGDSGQFLQTNGSGASTWAKVNLASTTNVSGIAPVGNGGTGLSTVTSNTLVKGNGSSAMVVTGVTVDSSQNISTAGSMATGVGGSVAGNIGIGEGTATSVASDTTQIQGAAAITGYNIVLPAAAGNGVIFNTNASNVVTQTFVNAETILASNAAVDMNTATATTLYVCPTGKTCVITRVTVSTASTSLTTASYSFGWNSASFNDVIANATHTELTGATIYTILPAKTGAVLGTSTGTFKVLNNTLQGGAATSRMDVFGYIY